MHMAIDKMKAQKDMSGFLMSTRSSVIRNYFTSSIFSYSRAGYLMKKRSSFFLIILSSSSCGVSFLRVFFFVGFACWILTKRFSSGLMVYRLRCGLIR